MLASVRSHIYIAYISLSKLTASQAETDRVRVLEFLQRTHHVIDISMEQMYDSAITERQVAINACCFAYRSNFCGNVLEVRTENGTALVMSTRAYNAFTAAQRCVKCTL